LVPFHGTPLRQVCEKQGLVGPDTIAKALTDKPMLQMPQYSVEEIEGIKKCFILYIKFPRDRWGEIRDAEKDTVEGNKLFSALKDEFMDKYFEKPINNRNAEFPGAADLEYGVSAP